MRDSGPVSQDWAIANGRWTANDKTRLRILFLLPSSGPHIQELQGIYRSWLGRVGLDAGGWGLRWAHGILSLMDVDGSALPPRGRPERWEGPYLKQLMYNTLEAFIERFVSI